MVWRPDMHHYACEADKIAAIIVPYVQGKCLDIGCGHGKVWPNCRGVDMARESDGRPVADICDSGTDLSWCASESHDAVFSSHFLEHVPPAEVPDTLREWLRVMKVGGHLVLYVPSANIYPKMGQPYANPDHKWDVYPGDIERILKFIVRETNAFGLTVKISEERNNDEEYSILFVAEKTAKRGEWHEELWQRNPGGKKRALVIRYGAIGDAFVAASVLPELKKQGYHITFNTVPRTADILRHDPNVDEWIVQENDFVQNHYLGPYWAALSKRYDHVVNLCESIEGLLLALPGRLNHGYPDESRKRMYDHINYLEHTHNIAGVPHNFGGSRFYATDEETRWARAVRKSFPGPAIIWCVNGSSPHKVYPWTQIVTKWLLERIAGCRVYLYGDPLIGHKLCEELILPELQREGCDMASVVSVADKWPIRKSLAFAQQADVIVGPETGPLNAMAFEPMAKVIYLSHSSPDNLTKHWINTTTLVAPPDRAPCYPCHRLHNDWSFCHTSKATSAALCASGITPETIMDAILRALMGGSDGL